VRLGDTGEKKSEHETLKSRKPNKAMVGGKDLSVQNLTHRGLDPDERQKLDLQLETIFLGHVCCMP
jgi:hypothetical protein